MSRRKPKITKRDKPGLPAELCRAIAAGKITPQRALRLIEDGGEATEPEIVNPECPSQNIVALRVNEVVIDWLAKRKHITPSMHEAATKLRKHFDKSGLDQLRAMDPTRDVVDGGQSKPEPMFRQKHLTEFNHAIKQLGPWSYSVISDVVLNDKKPEDASVSGMYRDKQRKGVETLTVLRMGLSILALHWGIPKDWKD
jgi:hypothetical protein